jgi:GNAT superfamily N-acetyltransferase
MLYAPEPLRAEHRVKDFTCGVLSLDTWIAQKARLNSVSGASRVFVVADENNDVAAYYSLSAGALTRMEIPNSARPNTPTAIPILVIGRFAVDLRFQRAGVGRSLLQDALVRCARVGREVGYMFVAVHPANETAAHFWKRWGFKDAPSNPPCLLLPISEVLALQA